MKHKNHDMSHRQGIWISNRAKLH